MKKKGFTLIELLAVILILGIIALIAIPTVTKIIETAKKNSLKVSASGVLEAGNYYYATNGKNIEDEIVFTCSGNKCTNGDKIVNYSGNVENGILVIKKNGNMGICINGGKYYVSKEIETDIIESGKGFCDSYEDGTFVVSSADREKEKYKQMVQNILLSNSVSWDFSYVENGNKEQEFNVPYDGMYKLEVWGAQGGSYDSTYIGGYGGYSSGKIKLKAGDTLYVNVGGAGSCGANGSVAGGYNGGGSAYGSYGSRYSGSGGGATHIALESGLLSTFSSKLEKLLIVAGGGGGSQYMYSAYGSGGSAGGYIGNASTWTNNGHSYYVQPQGGSQTAGGMYGYSYSAFGDDEKKGKFGVGGNYVGSPSNEGSGGGGGYYGGGAGQFAPGGGGSGYIQNSLLTNKVMYCYNCSSTNEELVKTISTNNVSDNAISNCAKIGNGYAKITLISLENNFDEYKDLYEYIVDNLKVLWNFDYTGAEQELIVPMSGTYRLEVWGAQGGNSSFDSYSNIGGYGAYSVGNIDLTKNDELYINVGGQGQSVQYFRSSSKYDNDSSFGYNGGGYAAIYTNNSAHGGGGGATHIATSSGLLSTFKDKKNEIIIVAGAGGGSATHSMSPSYSGTGGHGGGYLGVQGITNNSTCYGYGTGGSQEAIGSQIRCAIDGNVVINHASGFGYAGNYPNFRYSEYNEYSGGGSGYYGGGEGCHAPGGGGSSYIGNLSLTDKLMYCYNCAESASEATYTVNTKGTSDLRDTTNCSNGYSSNPVSKCAKAGHGYARITLISID